VDCAQYVGTVAIAVTNSGVVAAQNVVVHLFGGNPAQGGSRLAEHVLVEPIAPGASVAVDLAVPNFPENRDVTVWAFVDPGNTVEECNEADNIDAADNSIECPVEIVH
jgi:hypothetical protein